MYERGKYRPKHNAKTDYRLLILNVGSIMTQLAIDKGLNNMKAWSYVEQPDKIFSCTAFYILT